MSAVNMGIFGGFLTLLAFYVILIEKKLGRLNRTLEEIRELLEKHLKNVDKGSDKK